MSQINIFYATQDNPYNTYGYMINNSLSHHLEITNKTYQTSTLINNIDQASAYFASLNLNNLDSSLLTPGLRYSAPGFLVFERPPTKKLVQYVDMNVDSICEAEEEDNLDIDHNTFLIPIPWQIYFVTYSMNAYSKYRTASVKMYFSNTPLNHSDTVLYAPYIHNMFLNATLCNPMFETLEDIERYPNNLQGVIASAYDWIWNTGFNKDLTECIDQTLMQCKHYDNKIIKDYYIKYGSGNYLYFYDHLSKYELEDVVSQTWANPSFLNHFQADKEYYIYLAQKYVQDMNLIADPEDFDSDSEDEDYDEEESNDNDFYRSLRQTPHYQYIAYPHSKKKTYSEVIDFLFNNDYQNYYNNFSSDYKSSDKNNSFPNIASFANSCTSFFDVSIASS